MSQKRLLKSVLFVLNQSFFFQRIYVVKTLQRFEKPVKCRRTPAQFFNYRKTLVKKSRLDPDSLFVEIVEKNTEQIWKVCKMQENPCSIFYLWKNTLHLNPDPDFCARIRILDWDRLNIEKSLKTHSVQGNRCPFFCDWKTLVKTFHPKVVLIRITSILFWHNRQRTI